MNQNTKDLESEINLSSLLIICSLSALLFWPNSVSCSSFQKSSRFSGISRRHKQTPARYVTSFFLFHFTPSNSCTSIGQLRAWRHSYSLYVKQLLCKYFLSLQFDFYITVNHCDDNHHWRMFTHDTSQKEIVS